MRRIVTCLAFAALATGCVGAAPPTPVVIYVTPAPTADPVSTAPPFDILASPPQGRNLPVGTSPSAPTPRPPGHFDSITGQWVRDVVEAPTPTPTPAPTRAPTPTPMPPITEDELLAACAGTPIPHAAKYAGTVHPLVVVGRGFWYLEPDVSYGDGGYDINAKWLDDLWPSPIQLVVCVDDAKSVKVGSCGSYTRKSDGESGQIIRYRYTQKVRVVVARTGRQTGYTTLAGSIPTCEASLSIPASGPPPWDYYGDYPSVDAVNKYATAVSREKVE